MKYAMCGLDCSICEFKKNDTCTGCHEQKSQVFWGECPIAKCVMDKQLSTCIECEDFPCDLLKSFSYEEEQGDDGKRIRNLESLVK